MEKAAKSLLAWCLIAALTLGGCAFRPAAAPPPSAEEAAPAPGAAPEEEPQGGGKAEEVLAGMDTRRKVAQMVVACADTWNEQVSACLRDTRPGGVLLGGKILSEAGRNCAEIAGLTATLQSDALAGGGPALLICADQEGGMITRLPDGTDMPGAMALAAAGDPALARAAAAAVGAELLACGVNTDLAPVMDVNTDPANPVIGVRSFSDDPQTVAVFGTAYLQGLADAGVIGALKHFPGHGDTDTDSHTGLPSVDKTLDELRAEELVPFRAGIDAGADMVMTAHIVYPQLESARYRSEETGEEVCLPATLSRPILTGLLRGELGFEGVIVTDAMEMDAIAAHFGLLDASVMAINAGADLLLSPARIYDDGDCGAYVAFIDELAAAAERGDIEPGRIDESVLRILRLKEKYGLLDAENVPTDAAALAERALRTVGCEEHAALERRIACDAVTLVRDGGALPLRPAAGERVAIVTAWDSQIPSADLGLRRAMDAGMVPDGAEISILSREYMAREDVEKAVRGADVCVIFSCMYGAGYLTDPAGAAEVEALVRLAHESGGKAVVISCQLPYDTARFAEADAVLAAYDPLGATLYPDPAGGGQKAHYAPGVPAAVEALFGGDFTGTLPVRVPGI